MRYDFLYLSSEVTSGHWKKCALHNVEKLCDLSEVLWGKHGKSNNQNG